MSGNSSNIPNGPLIPSDSVYSKTRINAVAYPASKLILPSYAGSTIPVVSNPAPGTLVFNVSSGKLNFYNGTDWEEVTSDVIIG